MLSGFKPFSQAHAQPGLNSIKYTVSLFSIPRWKKMAAVYFTTIPCEP